MKKLFFTVLFTQVIFYSATANQIRERITEVAAPITVITGATLLNAGVGIGDLSNAAGIANLNDGTAYVQLSFDFNHYGTNFLGGVHYIAICSNGFTYLSMTNAMGTKITNPDNTALFTTALPNNTIAPFWDDLSLSNGAIVGSILYQTIGVAPNRVFVVQWENVASYATGSAVPYTFQLRLEETSNYIKFFYDNVGAGVPNTNESASIGVENGIGGTGNYHDLITGSSLISNSMIGSGEFPLFDYRLTQGVPPPIPGGFINVGTGQTIPNISEMLADLNNRGINAATTFNVNNAGVGNYFPALAGPITGTSAVNTITIRGFPTRATILHSGSSAGFFGNEASPLAGGNTLEPILGLMGTDFLTLENLELNTGPGGQADRGIHILNSSGTNGATNNTIRNNIISLNRLNPNSFGIEAGPITVMNSVLGANSNNQVLNNTITNANGGIWFNGSSGFPDGNTIIAGNTIGADYIGLPPGDIGGGVFPTAGIIGTNQTNITVSNNLIRNITVSGNAAGGILLDNLNGLNNTVSGNQINGIRSISPTSTVPLIPVYTIANPLGNGIVNIYNNSVHQVVSDYNQAPTASRQIKGFYLGGGANNTYNFQFNSVHLDGSSSPNISSTCLEIVNVNSINNIRNNCLGNFTGAQAGVAKHMTIYTPSVNSYGAPGSTSNNNNLFIPNTTNGVIGIGGATDYTTIPLWTAGMTANPGSDLNSINTDPLYTSPTNLHIQTGSPNINAAFTIPGITNDFDGQLRPNGVNPDIGYDEFYSTLPVSLLSFSGEKQVDGNLLRWTTVSEVNNLGFEVQRHDGNSYKTIGYVSSMATGGTSNGELNYQFLDPHPTGDKQLYRLRQVDFDQKSLYSNIVLIRKNPGNKISLQVFPNPVAGQLNVIVESSAKEKFNIGVYEMNGNKITEKEFQAGKGSSSLRISTSNLSKGIYLVRLIAISTGETITTRILKD